MTYRGVVQFVLLAALASSCASLTQGGSADVVSGHVTEIVEVGSREPVGSGMPQPFQVVRVQLEESLYRGEVVELQWGGRRALDPNGFLHVGDRVLLSVRPALAGRAPAPGSVRCRGGA